MEESRSSDWICVSHNTEHHADLKFIDALPTAGGGFLGNLAACEELQSCTSDDSRINKNDSVDLCHHRSDKTINIDSADEQCSMSVDELEKRVTRDHLSEPNVAKLGSSASDFHEKSTESEDPFECSEICLDDIGDINAEPSASAPQQVPNQSGLPDCAVEDIVVLRVWEGSPQANIKDEGGNNDANDKNCSSDDSFYVELTEEEASVPSEEYHSSSEKGLDDIETSSAFCKETVCSNNEQIVQEVRKESRGDKDPQKTGPLHEDVVDSEVVAMETVDGESMTFCETAVSEVDSLADRLCCADNEVVSRLPSEDISHDTLVTARKSNDDEMLDIMQSNDVGVLSMAEIMTSNTTELNNAKCSSPIVSICLASTCASAPSAVVDNSYTRSSDAGFSSVDVSNGKQQCSSSVELNESCTITAVSGGLLSIQNSLKPSASKISIADTTIRENAVSNCYRAVTGDPKSTAIESNQVCDDKQLSKSTKLIVGCSSQAAEVQATRKSDVETNITTSIVNNSNPSSSRIMPSTVEDDICVPIDFSVKNVAATTTASKVSIKISSISSFSSNRVTVEPVEDMAVIVQTNRSKSSCKSNSNHPFDSIPEMPCGKDLRLKRKLPMSSVEVPIKKEKQDEGYEHQAVNPLARTAVTCISTRSVNSERLSLPITNASTASMLNKRGPFAKHNPKPLSVKMPIAGSGEQDRFAASTVLSRHGGGDSQRGQSATNLPFCEALVTTVPAPISSHSASTRPQSVLQRSSVPFAPGLKSRSTMPAVITHTNIRHPFTQVAAPTSLLVAQALTRKVKSHFGRSFANKYMAPTNAPAELCLPPPRRYICSGCGDEYITLAGMQSHLGRRSMLLAFHCKCNLQKWPQIFYNPCSLASFYKAHQRQPGLHSPSLNTFTASVLREDTPEFVQLHEERKRQKDAEVAALNERLLQEQLMQKEAETAASNKRLLQEQMSKKRRRIQNKPRKIAKDASKALSVGSKESVEECQQGVSQKDVVCSSPVEGGATDSNVAQHGPKGREVQETIVLGEVHRENTSQVANFFEALNNCKTSCCGCGEVHTSRHALASHYVNRKPIDVDEHLCTKCGMSLPTSCAYIAHLRIHDQKKPYVCPECGVSFDKAESFEVFRRHVECACLHFVRIPASFDKCSRCSAPIPAGDARNMASHMVEVHTITYHKCQACPMAFGTAAAAERHSSNTGHNAQHRVVRKCPTCDAVFESTSSPDIYAHVQNHLTSVALQCSFCTLRFGSHSQVLDHVRSVHSAEDFQQDMCEVCGQSFPSPQLLYGHIVSTHSKYHKSILTETLDASSNVNSSHKKLAHTQKTAAARGAPTPGEKWNSTGSSFECVRCQMRFDTKELYTRHQAKHRFLENKKEAKRVIMKDDLSKEAVWTGETKQIPLLKIASHVSCMLCRQQFPDNAELEKHKLSDHGLMNYHNCYLCANCFESSDALSYHISSRHTGKALVHAFVCQICKETSDSVPRSFPHQGLLTKHLHTVHRMSRDEATKRSRAATQTDFVVDSHTHSTPPDGVVVRKLFVKGESESYLCAECGLMNADRGEFTAHVTATHPPELADAVQCMECSQSFPVAPALERHLRLVHRVFENVERYLTKNGRVPAPVVFEDEVIASSVHHAEVKTSTPLAASRTPVKVTNTNPGPTNDDNSSPRECNVCYRLFFSYDQLRAHMRVHGMAFIQGSRRKLNDSR